MPLAPYPKHLLGRLPIYKSQRLVTTDSINPTCLVMERDTIALVGNKQHFRSEGSADELTTHTSSLTIILRRLLCRNVLEHLRDGCTILSIKVGVDFVEKVEGCGVALL